MADVADKPTNENVEEIKIEKESAEKPENGSHDEQPDAVEAKEAETSEKDDESDGLSKLERSVIRQVEYYFGDANLNRDVFLMGQIKKDDDGWVPLTVLMTFKRLAALSSDVNVVIDSLLKSEEGLLEISEDRTKIRRHPERPIPEHNEENRKEIMSRTAYVKGFPLEAKIDEILEYFSPYNKVMNVTMRNYYDKNDKTYKFKGSVFVTFEKKEQTQSFIEKDDLTYKERPLIRKWQEKYLVEKREEREQARALKEKKKNKKKANQPEEPKIVLPTGTVLHFEGVNEDIKREVLREAIEKLGGNFKVAYIDFRQGDKEGYIRLHEEGSAEKFLESLEDSKLKVKDDLVVTLRKLTDEQETEFLAKVVEDMIKIRNNPNKRGSDKGGYRKRRFGNFNNSRNKKQKFDDE